MTTLDNDFLLEAEDDAQAVNYIQEHLSEELCSKFTEEDIYYILDVIGEYYVESGLLDIEGSNDEEIMIDLEAAANYVLERANKEKMGPYEVDDIVSIAELELEYAEGLE